MSSIYEQLGLVIAANRRSAKALDQFDCPHNLTHYEYIEHDQLPEQDSLTVTKAEICNDCGAELEPSYD